MVEVGDGGVEREVALEEQAVGLALLGDEGEPVLHRVPRALEVHEVVAEVHAPGGAGADAEDRLEQLGAAGTHEAVQAEDLAPAHVERDVLQVGGELRGEVLDRQDCVAGLVVDRREAVVERAAHHSGDELVHVGVGGVLGHDHVAVA